MPDVVPLTAPLLDEAAALLAARHTVDRARTPELPARFSDLRSAAVELRRILAAPLTRGVAAMWDGRMAGFLAGGPRLMEPGSYESIYAPPRTARIDIAGCAATGDASAGVIGACYAALAGGWVTSGFFVHLVTVPAAPQMEAAWRSLGFGRDATTAVRDAGPVVGAHALPAGVTIRRAGPADARAVVALVTANDRHHAGAPIFLPYPPEADAVQHRHQRRLLEDRNCACWLAERDGHAVAVQTFVPCGVGMDDPESALNLEDGYTAPSARGSGVAALLLDRGMAWARAQGYARCVVTWSAPNLLGARFWQSHGFRPLTHRLVRRVDERVAWAGAPRP